MKKKVLFLCTGNSCRSQMAEGLCRHYHSESIDPFSAGLEKHGLNPDAVKVMMEIGIDISNQFSKTKDELESHDFDYVITVCSDADENCPIFPAKTAVIHRGFDDPPKLAKNAATEEQRLAPFRRVRDEIKEFILSIQNTLNNHPD